MIKTEFSNFKEKSLKIYFEKNIFHKTISQLLITVR